MHQISDVAAIIDTLGKSQSLADNVRRVATLCGVVPGAVYNWRRDRLLPARVYPLINRELFKFDLIAPIEVFTMRQNGARKPRRRRANGR